MTISHDPNGSATGLTTGPTPERRVQLGRRAQLLAGASVIAWRGEKCGCATTSLSDGFKERCIDGCCTPDGALPPGRSTIVQDLAPSTSPTRDHP